jgi:hypothetical protein
MRTEKIQGLMNMVTFFIPHSGLDPESPEDKGDTCCHRNEGITLLLI